MFTKDKLKILFAGWAWVTLGSNKLKEKTIYDEKQRVLITEQRQYDLLSNVVSNSWSFGLFKSRLSAIYRRQHNVTRQMKSNIDKHSISSRGFIPSPFQDDCFVNTWELCSRYSKDSRFVFKLLQMWSDATAPAKTQKK